MKRKEMMKWMGRAVTVHTEIRRAEKKFGRFFGYSWEMHHRGKTRAGWIVGFRFRQEGHSEFLGEGEGSAFLQTGPQILAVQVAYDATSAVVNVPVDGFEWGGQPAYDHGIPWSKTDKDCQRENAAAQHRAKNGRFQAHA